MTLNDMQFCRAFAFIEALRIIEEKGNEREMDSVPLSTEAVKAIQSFTVAKATQFATLAFPLVSFPDETEREKIPFRYRPEDLKTIRGSHDESADLLGGVLARE